MRRNKLNPRVLAPALALLALLSIGADTLAQTNPRLTPPAAGKLVSVTGEVELRRAQSSQWLAATAGTLLNAGDSVRTGASGQASLLLADETLMQLHRNSTLRLKQVAQNAGWLRLATFTEAVSSAARSVYELASGRLWARNNNRDVDVEFETAVVTAGVRGTELTLEVRDDDTVRTVVLEGAVEHRNSAGRVVANAGEQVITRRGQLPAKSVLLQPRGAVQWLLVIPPLRYFDELGGPVPSAASPTSRLLVSAALDVSDALASGPLLLAQADDDSRQVLEQSLALAREQQYAQALTLVEGALQSDPDELSLLTLRAILNLHLGNVLEANAQLRLLTRRSPRQPLPWRYLTVTRVMLDDGQGALQASRRAVALQPQVADNHIVQAYAYQSLFDIPSAVTAARQAVSVEPENALANVTLARLLFGSGELEQPRVLLERAQQLDPDDAQAASLAGFVAVAQRDLPAALATFELALSLAPSLAEAHLGLGIIAMRGADKALALEEIATAVLLDPQRSLFISYWAKLLYQIKRFDRALQLLDRAEQLDPNDPTPAFYRAIVLRDLNRQGEAIKALHSAIEKNDNRAVYRSRFLLDRDLAVRNVDLSLLYNRLGLASWATRKAYAAVKSDYTNSSAHLFLAGALGEFGDRTIPLASELLVSLLYKPANVNTFNTFNDYTTLFETPSFGGRVRAAAGSDGLANGALTLFGAQPDANLAYTTAFEHFQTDGWRETNGEERSDAFVNLKWEPTEKDGFFGLAQVFTSAADDKPFPRYEFDDPPSPDDRVENDALLVEAGWTHRLSTRDQFIVYAAGQKFEGESLLNVTEEQNPFDVTLTSDTMFERPSAQLQSQFMQRRGNHQWHTGVLLYDGKTRVESVDLVELELGGVPVDSETFLLDNEVDLFYAGVYAQDNWRITPETLLEVALYLDHMENADPFTDETWTIDEVNPRLGLIWEPYRQHTLRASALRYVLPFASSRTDPTDVAGIPIFRNTTEGAVVTEANLAWEYEWANGFLSLGAFGLDQSFQLGPDTFDGELYGGEGRLNWLAGLSVGFSTGVRVFRAEDERDPALDRDEQTFDARLTAQYPNGFGAALNHTFRNMEFDSDRGTEEASATDIEFGYEFPDKTGSVLFEVRNIFDNNFNWVVDQFVFVGRNPVRETILTINMNF